MDSRTRSFAEVKRYLQKTEIKQEAKPQSEVRTVVLGKQVRQVDADGDIIYGPSSGPHQGQIPSLKAPKPTVSEELENILTQLGLHESDPVNKPSQRQGSLGRTALMVATLNKSHPLVHALLDHGADPSLTDAEGNNALILAAKAGEMAILKEYMAMVGKLSGDSNNQKLNDKLKNAKLEKVKNTKGLDQDLKAPEAASEGAESSARKPKSKLDNNLQRVLIDEKILTQVNKHNESVDGLLLEYKKQHPPKEDPKDKEAKEKSKLKPKAAGAGLSAYERSRKHLLDIEAAQKSHTKVAPKKGPSPAEKEAQEQQKQEAKINAELKKEYKAIEDRVEEARHRYDEFFTKHLHRDPLNPQIEFGSFTQDREAMNAALALVKDYYAPFSAPLPKGLAAHQLRRGLTGHWNRHHTAAAEALFTALSARDRQTLQGFRQFQKLIADEFQAISSLVPNKTIVTSSYLRRLAYVREALRKSLGNTFSEIDLSHRIAKDNAAYRRQAELKNIYFDRLELDRATFTPRVEEKIPAKPAEPKQVVYLSIEPQAAYAPTPEPLVQLEVVPAVNAGEDLVHLQLEPDLKPQPPIVNVGVKAIPPFKPKADALARFTIETRARQLLWEKQIKAQNGYEQFLKEHRLLSSTRLDKPVPAVFADQRLAYGTLCLIKDYYAPETTLIPAGISSPRLRRIFSFSWNRKHCQEAQDLFDKLDKLNLDSLEDIVTLHKDIKAELARIKPTQTRNTFSEYYSRLVYLEGCLGQAHAVVEDQLGDGPSQLYLGLIELDKAAYAKHLVRKAKQHLRVHEAFFKAHLLQPVVKGEAEFPSIVQDQLTANAALALIRTSVPRFPFSLRTKRLEGKAALALATELEKIDLGSVNGLKHFHQKILAELEWTTKSHTIYNSPYVAKLQFIKEKLEASLSVKIDVVNDDEQYRAALAQDQQQKRERLVKEEKAALNRHQSYFDSQKASTIITYSAPIATIASTYTTPIPIIAEDQRAFRASLALIKAYIHPEAESSWWLGIFKRAKVLNTDHRHYKADAAKLYLSLKSLRPNSLVGAQLFIRRIHAELKRIKQLDPQASITQSDYVCRLQFIANTLKHTQVANQNQLGKPNHSGYGFNVKREQEATLVAQGTQQLLQHNAFFEAREKIFKRELAQAPKTEALPLSRDARTHTILNSPYLSRLCYSLIVLKDTAALKADQAELTQEQTVLRYSR